MPQLHRNTSFLIAVGVTAALLLSACTGAASVNGSASASSQGSAATSSEAATTASSAASQDLTSSNGALSVTLTAAETQVPYEQGTRWAMTYNGTSAGPTLRVHPGDTLTVTLVNKLNEPTSLHTHGLHVSPEGDSDNPFVTVDPGQSKTYIYKIPADQPAGTFWYHPHAHGMAAEQVASGLSGALIVENTVDTELADTTTDRVLVVTDPPLTTENPWGAGQQSSGSMMDGMGMGGSGGVDMMTQMLGRAGPRLLTNGQDGIDLTGSNGRLERARIVNATASSRLVLTWIGASMQQLSSEGGRLNAPSTAESVSLAPGERTELVLVPGADGGQLLAQRLSNEGSGGPLGTPEVLARVSADAGTDTGTLPTSLTSDVRDLFASDAAVAKKRVITLDGHMNPSINGTLFDPNTINFEARQGTVEEWVIRNKTPMYHPIHLHSWPFQVQGEQGWQDLVEVPPYSEKVIRVTFDDFGGTTVLHCHILDHEDTGMMAIIKVQ